VELKFNSYREHRRSIRSLWRVMNS